MTPTPPDPGPPDEPSRKELERLDKILTGGRWRFVAARLVRGAIPFSIFFIFFVLNRPQSLRYTSALPYLIGSQVAALLFSAVIVYVTVWPRFQRRAAAIRSGSSYAAPAELKDYTIFQWSSVALMLVWFAIQWVEPTDVTGTAASTFIFIAIVVTSFWAFGKALLGYNRCPVTHLRREELGNDLFIAAASLFLFFLAATTFIRILNASTTITRIQMQTSPPKRAP